MFPMTAAAQETLHGLHMSAGWLFDRDSPTAMVRMSWFTQSYSSLWWDVALEGLYNSGVSGVGLAATVAYTWDWMKVVPSFYLRFSVGELSTTDFYTGLWAGLVLEYLYSRRTRFFMDFFSGGIAYPNGSIEDSGSDFGSLSGFGVTGGITWVLGEEW